MKTVKKMVSSWKVPTIILFVALVFGLLAWFDPDTNIALICIGGFGLPTLYLLIRFFDVPGR